MKSVILRLVQGTPLRWLACSYVTLPRKAKLLACPPQTCFGFVCFCQILQGRGHWLPAICKCTISFVAGIISQAFLFQPPHLAIASCCFSVTDPDKLITCHSTGHSCLLVDPHDRLSLNFRKAKQQLHPKCQSCYSVTGSEFRLTPLSLGPR